MHINFWVLTCVLILLKAKCDHIHRACTNGFAPTWWIWSRRDFSLLTAYQILSANFISQPTWQSCDSKLQYNTCRRRAKQFSVLGYLIVLTTCLSSISVGVTTYGCSCILRCSICFCSPFSCISSLPRSNFRALLPPQNWWPHINHSVLGFDHIFDHKQNRSTRRQECTRVWKGRFCVAESLRKSKNG